MYFSTLSTYRFVVMYFDLGVAGGDLDFYKVGFCQPKVDFKKIIVPKLHKQQYIDNAEKYFGQPGNKWISRSHVLSENQR